MISCHLADVQTVRVLSELEGIIELAHPNAAFPAVLSFRALSIMPEGTEEIGASGVVATGPFRVIRFEPERRLELEANPHYWRSGLPRVERLIFTFGVSPDEIVSRLVTGRSSLAVGLQGDSYRRLRQDPELGSRESVAATFGTCFVAFNGRHGRLTDKQLRQHLFAAIDVPAIVQQQLGPMAIVATSLIPPGLLGHNPSRRSAAQPTEIKGARPQLRGNLYTTFRIAYRGVATEVGKAFRGAGIELELTDSYNIWAGDDVDVHFRRWVADFPDANGFVGGLLKTGSGIIAQACGSPEIDQLIERGRSETDPAMRSEIYREIDDILMREALVLPLFHEQLSCFARPEVDGFTVRRFRPFFPFEQISVR
jgi:ABC-type transport system substrate-binding protein